MRRVEVTVQCMGDERRADDARTDAREPFQSLTGRFPPALGDIVSATGAAVLSDSRDRGE